MRYLASIEYTHCVFVSLSLSLSLSLSVSVSVSVSVCVCVCVCMCVFGYCVKIRKTGTVKKNPLVPEGEPFRST
jgi:hypothetical protein